MPIKVTDLSVPKLDADEDGEDDGGPEDAAPIWGSTCITVGGNVTCVTILEDSFTQEWRPSSTWHAYRYVCLSVSGTTSSSYWLWIDSPARPVNATSMSPDAGAARFSNGWNDALIHAYSGPVGGAGGAYTPGSTHACPSGTTHWFRLDAAHSSGTMPGFPSRLLGIGLQYQSGVTSWAERPSEYELGTGYFGGTQEAQFVAGAGASMVRSGENTIIRCSETYTGEPTITYEWDSSLRWVAGSFWAPAGQEGPPKLVDGDAQSWTAIGDVGISDATFTSSDCPYLVEIEFWVCAYTGHSPDDYGCGQDTWSADRFRQHSGYANPDAGATETICRLYPDDPQCYALLNPPYVDGTDWDQVCGAGFPALTWGDYTWLPAVIGHLAECLFVPANGFDRHHVIQSAVSTSAVGDLQALITAGADAFTYSPGCGVLVGDALGGDGENINTCEWSSWAAGAKQVITLLLLAGFALWALNFIIDMVTGIPNRTTPSPTGGKS
ncbi:hypothetical protein [Protaetiibacter larvae]|uniref:Uncharacterized protein n=1 Tax=Protaetiibacter larvae TaxID=2592654 RepID=A0A5C1Y808_9MICO|nr:hypothetical protein [Protaetiibacter larvae]QEO10011.1 hypothetical protein FLP23_08340 [Protaetiibacter larvae]